MGDVPSTPIVFLGPPASGKGTQARRLAELRDHAYLSTGGLLRRALQEKSELGEEARPYLDRGEYVPDGIMVPMVLEWVSGKQGKWILDGFPRTLAQAKALDDALGEVVDDAGGAQPGRVVGVDDMEGGAVLRLCGLDTEPESGFRRGREIDADDYFLERVPVVSPDE